VGRRHLLRVDPRRLAAPGRCRSLRPATGGRPGDRNGALPDRSERRFRLFIATSFIQVLRRPFESAQYCSIDYQAALRGHGILISMSERGNCYNNPMVETFFKTLKSELVWRTIFHTRPEAD
jgi:putative transposase